MRPGRTGVVPPLSSIACCLLGALACGFGATVLDAAEWYARPRLSQTFEYDDNIGFSRQDETAAFGSRSSAMLNLGGRSPTFSLDLDTRFDFVRFPEEDGFNSNDQFFTLTGQHQGRRSQLTLVGRFDRDTKQDDDIEATGEREFDNTRRETLTFEPSFSYQLTERQTAALYGRYLKRSYPSLSDEELPDYSLLSAGASWTYALTERTALGFGPSILFYDSNVQDATVAGFQGILAHSFTPRLRLDLRGGPSLSRTESRLATPTGSRRESDSSFSYLMDANLQWAATPRTNASLGYVRSSEPSGSSGDLVERDRITLRLDHDVTRRVGLFALAVYQNQTKPSSDVDDGGDDERESLRFEPGIRWALTEDLDLSIRYRLKYLDFKDLGEDAISNAILLRLDLRLPELRTSW
jgi:hypothetical protein